jgi:hypothetical protein
MTILSVRSSKRYDPRYRGRKSPCVVYATTLVPCPNCGRWVLPQNGLNSADIDDRIMERNDDWRVTVLERHSQCDMRGWIRSTLSSTGARAAYMGLSAIDKLVCSALTASLKGSEMQRYQPVSQTSCTQRFMDTCCSGYVTDRRLCPRNRK